MKKFIVTILTSIFTLGLVGQAEPNYGPDKDKCLEKISLYSGYLKQKQYKDAYRFWKEAVATCPEYKPLLYSNGVYILKKLSKDESIPEDRQEALRDSIRVVYEAGIKIFGATPDILEDYGNDLILYARDYEAGAKNIKEAIDGLREETKYSTIMYYSQALRNLENAGTKDCEELVTEYERLSQFIETNKDKQGYDKAQEYIDKYLGPCLTCDKLVPVLEKKREEAKTNAGLREKILKTLTERECTDSEIYEELITISCNEKPTCDCYQGLAIIQYNKGDKAKALDYFDKAAELCEEKAEKEKILEKAAGIALTISTSKAQKYANELLDLNSSNGTAYIIKASAMAQSGCGASQFEVSTKYWVAYDLAAKAKSLDASVADKADKLLGSYRARFPEQSEIFAQGLKVGDSYTHCSGATTTVRAR